MNSETKSPPATTVRRATPADAALLGEFYALNFANRPRLNDKALWVWEFADQPGAVESFPFLLLESDGCIEGGIGLLRFGVRVDTHTIAGAHPVNYFVNPSFKGLHALRLFRAALTEAPLVLGSYISNAAMPLVKLSGFIDLSQRYFAYYFSLRRTSTTGPAAGNLRNTALVIARRIWLAALHASTQLRNRNLNYVIADTLDAHWSAHAESWRLADCCLVKNSTYLAWRYAASPVLHCRFVWQLRGNIPVGLAVLHLDLTRGEAVLLDCIAENNDPWRLLGLISRSMICAREAGANLWSTHVLSEPLQRVLRLLGCGQSQSPYGIYVLCTDTSLREKISDPRCWHLMIGDTDVY